MATRSSAPNVKQRRHGERRKTRRPKLPRSRRGVVLLVVLSLLMLFLIIGVTYALVGTTYRGSAERTSNSKDRWDDSLDDLDRAMYALLRDTTSRNVMQSHSLLHDLHGPHGVKGTLPTLPGAVSVEMQGQFMLLNFNQNPTGSPNYFRRQNAVYNGCVLTFLTGPAAYHSTRILASIWTAGPDNAWGQQGVDDLTVYNQGTGTYQGDGNVDDVGERGWRDSDDVLTLRVEMVDSDNVNIRGADQQWGVANVDDDGGGTVDDIIEAGWPGSDDLVPRLGDRFLINGRPFSGTGAGYNPNTGNLDAVDPANAPLSILASTNGGEPPYLALLPNFAAYPNTHYLATAGGVLPANLGGANEDRDTPDYQDMWLAWVTGGAQRADQIIPSFHRPALIRYWFAWLQTNMPAFGGLSAAQQQQVFVQPYGPDNYPAGHPLDTGDDPAFLPLPQRVQIVNLKRRIIMRPLPEDHPNFDGSNLHPTLPGPQPNFLPFHFGMAPIDSDGDGNTDYTLGSWDVDNDGDGVPDSIWIDLGFPVKTAPDGRKYKPLFAFLVQDMDGRINLNAHGTLAQLDPNFTTALTGFFAQTPPSPAPGSYTLPRGSGFGPAEINLAPLFTAPAQHAAVLTTRYGADGLPGLTAPPNGFDDLLSYFKHHGTPSQYGNWLMPSNYASPPDMFGRGGLALDYTGQPMTFFMGQLNEPLDDPYEINLIRQPREQGSAADTPYTLAELEAILRRFDRDARTLPQRLAQLGPFANSAVASAVTTDSRHIPMPAGAVPRERRSSGVFTNLLGGTNQMGTLSHPDFSFPTLIDLYRERLIQGGVPANAVAGEMAKLIPFEILRGEPLDVNRAFGNGQDDTPNPGMPGRGTVDEPLEVFLGEVALPQGVPAQGQPTVPANYVTPLFNYVNDDPAGPVPVRHQYARHLFCLMSLMVEAGFQFPVDANDTQITTAAQLQELTSRRIAQWAVNVVDFRDSDAIMTIFEYDANPWNGWLVDGDPRTDETIDPVNPNPDRRVTVGCEFPDLMMTETVAFHDRRIKDTNYDTSQDSRGSGMNDDDDVDQFRIPQGSLFIELFCPRPHADTTRYPNANPMLPQELYNAAGRLDLARVSPARPDDNFNYPVWQIALSEQHTHPAGVAEPEESSPRGRIAQFWESTSFHPPNMELPNAGVTPAPLAVDRLVWFAPVNPNATSPAFPLRQRTYHNNRPWDISVEPGQYAVVGPRPVTSIGSIDDADPVTPYDGPSAQGVTLQAFNRADPTATGVVVTNMNGTLVTPAPGQQIRSAVGIVADVERGDWAGNNPSTQYIGMSVTEPLPIVGDYYPEPNPNLDWNTPPDSYDDPDIASMNHMMQLPDRPYDDNIRGATRQPPLSQGQYDMQETNSYRNIRSAFLQRLADPTIPWNPMPGHPMHNPAMPTGVNPYITIDWASIDATVFSGEENTNRQVDGEDLDPLDPPGPRQLEFGGRQRGNNMNPAATPRTTNNMWSPVTVQAEQTFAAAPGPNGEYFTHTLFNTLSYLNSKEANPALPAGRLIAPGQVAQQFAGSPVIPFPWLTWYNRPFNNPYELMLVPNSSPPRLMLEFATSTVPPLGVYNPNGGNVDNFRAPYRHLFNFFHGTQMGGSAGSNLCRFFEFVQTKSPFVDTEKWYNPTLTAANPNNPLAPGAKLRPPYNTWSRFRDPGRININTMPITHWNVGGGNGADGVDDDGDGLIDEADEVGWPGSDDTPDSLVFHALMNNFPDFNTTGYMNWVFASRQGYAAGFNDLSAPAAPTRFADPFRSAFSADRMPPVPGLPKDDVQATLLRVQPGSTTNPLFSTIFPRPYRQTDRHAQFAYQGLQRLPNLVTTRSNVFAVWITVGHFEVEQLQRPGFPPGTPDEGHLDGYLLGKELGVNTGKVTRHRGFYIIDRSIPVAYEPGVNHNVDRAVLLRRKIE